MIPRIAVEDPQALVGFIRHVFGAAGDAEIDEIEILACQRKTLLLDEAEPA